MIVNIKHNYKYIIHKYIHKNYSPIKNKCPENVRTNSEQIPETECLEIVPKRVHFPTFRICLEPVFVQFLSRICPEPVFVWFLSRICLEFVQNFKWKLSRKHPDFSF